MIEQGAESMALVVQMADKIEEQERRAIILACVGAILFLVPIAGEVLGTVAAIIFVMGTLGEAAFDVYTIVDDPKNAPLTIVGLVMAPMALLDITTVAKAAQIQRGMNVEDVAKLGERVGQRLNKVQAVTGTCSA